MKFNQIREKKKKNTQKYEKLLKIRKITQNTIFTKNRITSLKFYVRFLGQIIRISTQILIFCINKIFVIFFIF